VENMLRSLILFIWFQFGNTNTRATAIFFLLTGLDSVELFSSSFFILLLLLLLLFFFFFFFFFFLLCVCVCGRGV